MDDAVQKKLLVRNGLFVAITFSQVVNYRQSQEVCFCYKKESHRRALKDHQLL